MKKKPKKTTSTSSRAIGIRYGFRSGLEEAVAAFLRSLKILFGYESETIRYTEPSKERRYTPDFILPNGVIIETKGRFTTADRQKHLYIKQEHPDLDIRFVFSNSKNRISKQSKTTYAAWCEKYGFQYADKQPPLSWLEETKE